MEIPLLFLVLQIVFNAALNNRGYSSNRVIPSLYFVNSGQTRRLAEIDTHLQLSSRGLPDSDEESESGYSGSFEDYSYRSVRQLQRYPNQRKNEYLRYNSPGGNINSNNQVQSLSSYPYLRRPYLRNGVSNLRPDQISQNYRKANDDSSSLEVSSLESTNSEDASRLGEEATYLRSLLSLMEQQNNRKSQSRKYYGQGNSLNIGLSPNSLNNRRNNNLDDRQVDSFLLVADDEDKSDEIPIRNPTLKSPELTGLRYNKLYRRNYDPMTRRLNRKSNKNAGLDSPLNDNTEKLTVLRLASLEDLNLESSLLRSGNNRKNNHRNFLRLSLSPENQLTLGESVASDLSDIFSETLDGLHLTPVNLRRTDLPNNKYSRRNNNGLNVEENSLRLGSLHVPKPASPLRRYRGNLRTHGNHTRQVLKKLSPLRRYRDPANLSSNRSLQTHGNHSREVPKTETHGDTVKTIEPGLRTHGKHTRQELKKLFEEDTAKILVPYHEGKSKKLLNNRKHENQNNNRKDDGWPDEFSLDTLFAFRKEDDLAEGLKNQDNLNIEPSLLTSSDEIPPKHDDKLHLEFPWNDSLSPDDDKDKLLLRTHKRNGKSKDTTDALNLEFPWNDALSPNAKSKLKTDEKKDNSTNTSDTLHLEFPWNGNNAGKGKSQLRNDDDKNDKSKDTTEALHLEFPWNDALSPDGDKSASQLRIDGKRDKTEDTTDTLQLEFPWNNVLSSKSNKENSKLRTVEQKDETNDTLKLEFPWNDVLSSKSDKENSKLRTDEQKDETNDTLKLEFPWNDVLSSKSDKENSKLRTHEQKDETNDTLKLEFPWNDVLSSKSDKENSKLRTDEQKDEINDTLKLEFPWNDVLSSKSDKKNSKVRTDEQKYEINDKNDTLKLEFPWNDALSSNSDKQNSKLRTDEQKDKSKDTTEKLNLEPPWNGALSPDVDKGKLKLKTDGQIDETKNTNDTLSLEFPWNDVLSPNSNKSKKMSRSKDDTNDALHLEYPWNGQLSPDSNETEGIKSQSHLRSETDRKNKEPQDDLKLEFPWNGQTGSDKPSSQKTTRLPDPFYIHPYLRNRNVNKHPNYFRQSYDVYSRGRRLDNLKNRRSGSHHRQSKRRRYDDLSVIGLNSRSTEEDPSDLITFPDDRRLQSKENNTPKHTSH